MFRKFCRYSGSGAGVPAAFDGRKLVRGGTEAVRCSGEVRGT